MAFLHYTPFAFATQLAGKQNKPPHLTPFWTFEHQLKMFSYLFSLYHSITLLLEII
ncbi:hypothetical protein Sjap_020116 [Stephania japonica]|uniref:Uncharacterized protein n=1 Tax=Stephania japonica TaxID=461633 RepID=A0AAP0F2W6_9MAGN